MKKKLAIIGRGTVGCMAVVHFLKWTDWDIDWIYDPKIEPAAVGEGTTLRLPASLAENVGFDGPMMDKINSHIKLGIWKRGWGSGQDFYHAFPAGSTGLHFNAVQFQDFIFSNYSTHSRINCIESNTTDYENLDSDFVMVCTGAPRDLTDDYNIRKHIPVNAAIVRQCPWEFPKFDYSVTFAKKHGWVFGIPLKNRCAIGYIYNSQISTEEEITEDVQDVLSEFKLEPSLIRKLNFKNYSKKQNYTEKVIFNGNASFFLEPLEATSTGLADIILRRAFDVWNGTLSVDLANQLYNIDLDEIESMISLHYFSGSMYDTEFWKYAVPLAEDKILENFRNKTSFADIIKHSIDREKIFSDNFGRQVGSWSMFSYTTNIDNLGIKEKLKDLIKQYNI